MRSEGPGGGRKGGVEHFYRGTELPFIDSESWSLIPYSVRAATTWNDFYRDVFPRLRKDIEESSKAGIGRELSCRSYTLDEKSWARAAQAAYAQFIRLFEEQEDARRRVIHSGEELFRADVFLIAFQPFRVGTEGVANDFLVERQHEPLMPFTKRLAPILEDDVCLEIISELNHREVSVTQFHDEAPMELSDAGVRRRFRNLERSGWLVKGKSATGGMRRGAREQFYRATKPAYQSFDPRVGLPSRQTEQWDALIRLGEEATEAMARGTFDGRTDRCQTWSLIRIDMQGWNSVIAGIESLSEFISCEQERSRRRMAKSGEKPVPMTVGLAAFKAPKETVKAP